MTLPLHELMLEVDFVVDRWFDVVATFFAFDHVKSLLVNLMGIMSKNQGKITSPFR